MGKNFKHFFLTNFLFFSSKKNLFIDSELTEEEMILQNAASVSEEAANAIIKAALVVKLRDGMGSLGRILKAVETYKGAVIHL